jgi:hypothetical protein
LVDTDTNENNENGMTEESIEGRSSTTVLVKAPFHLLLTTTIVVVITDRFATACAW